MVRMARSWAGLRPGINFSIPNQKNMIPTLNRNNKRPFFDIHDVMFMSARLNKLFDFFIRCDNTVLSHLFRMGKNLVEKGHSKEDDWT